MYCSCSFQVVLSDVLLVAEPHDPSKWNPDEIKKSVRIMEDLSICDIYLLDDAASSVTMSLGFLSYRVWRRSGS